MGYRFTAAFSLVICLAANGAAQKQPILQSRPDVVIWVRKSEVGPDYVRVQMVDADYPPAVFQRQCQAIGQYLGSALRGLDIQSRASGSSPGGKPTTILGAEFAADGLIDRNAGTLELNAFAKAFAGSPAPNSVDSLAIIFENEIPKEGSTLKSWSGESADVTANFDPNIPMVEYRVALKTQNPDGIKIPKSLKEQTKPALPPSKDKPQSGLVPWVIGAALLVGVLVSFALRPRPSTTPRGRAER